MVFFNNDRAELSVSGKWGNRPSGFGGLHIDGNAVTQGLGELPDVGMRIALCSTRGNPQSAGHGVSPRIPASSAKRTIRRTVFRSVPVNRAMARIFSPANQRRIT